HRYCSSVQNDRGRLSACDEQLQKLSCFFFQAEDGIRDATVTGVQTCALPISMQCTAPPNRQGRIRRFLPQHVLKGVHRRRDSRRSEERRVGKGGGLGCRRKKKKKERVRRDVDMNKERDKKDDNREQAIGRGEK